MAAKACPRCGGRILAFQQDTEEGALGLPCGCRLSACFLDEFINNSPPPQEDEDNIGGEFGLGGRLGTPPPPCLFRPSTRSAPVCRSACAWLSCGAHGKRIRRVQASFSSPPPIVVVWRSIQASLWRIKANLEATPPLVQEDKTGAVYRRRRHISPGMPQRPQPQLSSLTSRSPRSHYAKLPTRRVLNHRQKLRSFAKPVPNAEAAAIPPTDGISHLSITKDPAHGALHGPSVPRVAVLHPNSLSDS